MVMGCSHDVPCAVVGMRRLCGSIPHMFYIVGVSQHMQAHMYIYIYKILINLHITYTKLTMNRPNTYHYIGLQNVMRFFHHSFPGGAHGIGAVRVQNERMPACCSPLRPKQ